MSKDQLRPLQEREYQKITFDEVQIGDQIRIELNTPSLVWPGRPLRKHGKVFRMDTDMNEGMLCFEKGKLFGKRLVICHEEWEILGIERFQ